MGKSRFETFGDWRIGCKTCSGAAASLREGMDETVTVVRLNLSDFLQHLVYARQIKGMQMLC